MTPREFHALSDVHQRPIQRWAIDAAMFASAHRGKDEIPFEADDFLVPGNRERRRQETMIGKLEAAAADMRAHSAAKKLPKGKASLEQALAIFAGEEIA